MSRPVLTSAHRRTFDPDKSSLLGEWLAAHLGATTVGIEQASLLGGGAIGENWLLDVSVNCGVLAGEHRWVLRTDAQKSVGVSLGREREFACLAAAHAAGVTTPLPIAACADPAIIGAPFLIVGHEAGTAQGRQIVRDPGIDVFGPRLARRLGSELAKLHQITQPAHGLDFLPVTEFPARERVALLRRQLDRLAEPRPVLEYILTWLDRNAPRSRSLVLCHGDYRTGNYLVNGGNLTAILDWEFAHWGDPHEDIAWFCARCWRFGAEDREAGGIAARSEFYNGYNSLASMAVDQSRIPYWEAMAAARWATIALLQGQRYRDGEESLELLLTGLMAPEMEFDALDGIMQLAEGGVS